MIEREFTVGMSGEALGVALKLGWENEKNEDINHIHVVQTQHALQGGVDSMESC